MQTADVEALVEALGADDAILDETVRVLRESLPGYESIPTESLRASARRNRALSMRTLLEGRAPEPEEIDEPRALMEERMGQGIAIVSVLAGFRLSMSVIQRHLLDHAPRHGVSADAALRFSNQLWALGDAFTTRAVVVYRDRSIAEAVADSTRRTQWIRDAVVGVLDRDGLRQGAQSHDVGLDATVRAVLADVGTASHDDPTARLQDWAERAGVRVLAAARGTGAVGILVGEPGATPTGDAGWPAEASRVTIAVGPPVGLEHLAESFAGATRVLEAARRIGREGVVDLERLSWRMGILASPETTELLLERLVAPVLDEGEFGDLVLEALGAYLDHGLSIPLAAASIPVHVNTLRYRLKRFTELTGASVHRLETLIEASWALTAHRGNPGYGHARSL